MSEEIEIKFEWEELEKGLREPFIGVVVHSAVNCGCALCQRLKEKAQFTNGVRVHVGIVPIDKDIKPQSVQLPYKKKLWSAFGAWVLAFRRLGMNGITLNELGNYIFEFKELNVVDFVEKYSGFKRPSRLPEALEGKMQWMPVRVVKIDELQFVKCRKEIEDLKVVGKLNMDEIRKVVKQIWDDYINNFESQEVSDVGDTSFDISDNF